MLVLIKFQHKSSKFPSGSHLVHHQLIPLASLDVRCWNCRNLGSPSRMFLKPSHREFQVPSRLEKRSFSFSSTYAFRHYLTQVFFSNNTASALSNLCFGTSQKEEVLQKTSERHLITLSWQAWSWHCSRWNTCYATKKPPTPPVNFILVQQFIIVNSQLK